MRTMTALLVVATGLCTRSDLAAPRGGGEVVEVPFVFEHNEILIQARIGRHGNVTMMLDTDADPSSIDLSFAQSNGFKLREVRGQVTGGGSERPKAYLTRLEGVALGPLPAGDLGAVAIDLSKIQNRLGIQVQGVLGNNFLAGRVLQIDYPATVLRFYRSSSALPAAKNATAVFPFRLEDEFIVMEGAAINGKNAKATVDTGSNGTFALTPAAVEAFNLTEAASHGDPETSVGARGAVQSTRGKADRIALGPIEIASPEVVFWGKGAGRDRRPWELDIGNGFLKDYILTLDYQKKRISASKAVTSRRRVTADDEKWPPQDRTFLTAFRVAIRNRRGGSLTPLPTRREQSLCNSGLASLRIGDCPAGWITGYCALGVCASPLFRLENIASKISLASKPTK